MVTWTRRRAIGAITGGTALALLGVRCALPAVVRHGPVKPLDERARKFADKVLGGLDRKRLWDVHCHLVGVGRGTRCFVSEELKSHLHPIKRFQFEMYLAATGLEDNSKATDKSYLERLLELHRKANPEGKLIMIAFDVVVDEDGVEHPDHSELFTPNEYVLATAKIHDDVFAGGSVHPYRKDAAERIHKLADEGVRLIKWLPNTMKIDPASPRCRPMYDAMAERGMYLLTHGGDERAVDAAEAQAFGNPLRLRVPLERNVKIIVAHCASTGLGEDLDKKGKDRPWVDNFRLLMRMLEEKETEGRLFADISALTQINRCGEPLLEILRAEHLHSRLVNGSDYPLPAIDPLISTRRLVSLGYLTDEEREECNHIYKLNPLLFDLVVKRCLKTERDGKTIRFADEVFESARLFL